jgi:hypothetical protein
LFGIAGLFLALSALFFIDSTRAYVDIGIPEGTPCDSCIWARQAAFSNAILLGIAGGIVGAIGAWFTITGYRQQTPSISA